MKGGSESGYCHVEGGGTPAKAATFFRKSQGGVSTSRAGGSSRAGGYF